MADGLVDAAVPAPRQLHGAFLASQKSSVVPGITEATLALSSPRRSAGGGVARGARSDPSMAASPQPDEQTRYVVEL